MYVDSRNSIIRDGYVFIEDRANSNRNTGVFDTLYLNPGTTPDDLEKVVRYINEKAVSKVHLDNFPVIEFIAGCPLLKAIHLELGQPLPSSSANEWTAAGDLRFSLDFLCEFEYLEALTIADGGYPKPFVQKKLDCRCMKSAFCLRCLSTDAASVQHIECLANLEELAFIHMKSTDLQQLSKMTQLRELRLIQSTISSLNGLKNAKLHTLDVSYCRKLHDISALSELSQTLEHLVIDHCPKINDISICADLTCLKVLELDGNNDIASLSPLKNLTNLEVLTVYVNVVDGDLNILKRMRAAACSNRKHYNVKNEELPG